VSFSPGQIVLVEHRPPNDPSAIKARPALIISNRVFNDNNLDLIIFPITSVIRQRNQAQITIKETDDCFPLTGLHKTSSIKCNTILTYPKNRVRRKLGDVPKNILVQARKKIISFITEV